MKKQRFRDIKQGKGIKKPKEEKKHSSYRYPYAKASSKIKAFLTDTFMLTMPIMYVVIYLFMGGREHFAEHKLIGWGYILIPLVIIQTLFMIKTAQTPGYRAYDLKIIDEQTGKKPTPFILLFRNACVVLSFFSFIGWTMMFFRKDAKTLHDLLSRTAVIYQL